MRHLPAALLVLLAAASAPRAQTAPSTAQVVRWTAGGTACGVFGGAFGAFGGPPLMLVAMPTMAALCVLRSAENAGFETGFWPTMGDAALGATAGLGLGYAVGSGTTRLLLATTDGHTDGIGEALVGIAVGAVVLTATSAYVAARRVHRHGAPAVDTAPVALRLPDGSTVAGVAFRIAL